VTPRFEFPPELRAVVDFAIENQDRVIALGHGLLAVVEVDDLQADSAE
jgi:hypothetical protein